MSWHQSYHRRQLLSSSLWLLPLLGMVLALLVAPVFRWLDWRTQWTLFHFTPDGARAVLGAFSASMLTFFVFVLSSMIIVVQLASAQLTPRIIAMAFAMRQVMVTLGIFTFAYTYTLAALGRVVDAVPQLPVAIAVVANLVSIIVFVRFVHHFGMAMRPISVLQSVGHDARTVIESVHPDPYDGAQKPTPRTLTTLATPARIIEYAGAAGVVQAFSTADIVEVARRGEAAIEMIPQVGDFIAGGDPLFRVAPERSPVDVKALQQCVAIGSERTMEQDPRFAFRIMVDIANKALSPAINDPTTAVLALDQLHRLLLYVGGRRLHSGEVRDADGTLRLLYKTPDWPDYVLLAASEIRCYGTGSIQVARRLRAMLEHLLRTLPEARREALQQELLMLQESVERGFSDLRERRMAGVSDMQGVGGSAPSE
jgi:uncharacterized membrane protein